VANTHHELKHEITRENSLTQQQLDAWRLFVTGQQPAMAEEEPPELEIEPEGATDDDLTIVEEE
jgi:hypothetical protein